MSILTQRQMDTVRPRNAELANARLQQKQHAAMITDLHKDRERLNFLQANPHVMLAADDRGWTSGHAENFQNYALNVPTIREAIDAAMKANA